MKKLLLVIFALSLLTTAFIIKPDFKGVTAEDKLAEVLKRLEDKPLSHYPDTSITGVSAEQGKQLVLTGFALDDSKKKVAKQSAHFVCTSCHNVKRDEPDLSKVDPQARLDYVEKKGLPYLQGSALYGVVNRSSFYNGDYEKKYGELVKPARNNLREAIQLCATECAQGRRLATWEVESILAYLWTIDLKLEDLNLTEIEYSQINSALETGNNYEAAIDLLRSKYFVGMPATFVAPPEDRSIGYSKVDGNPANGKRIYDLSCKHCHEQMRYSFFELNDAKNTFKFLDRHIPRYTRYSIYQVSRYGTSPLPGKGAYMPQYTLEKMSLQQSEDLRAYIEEQAVAAE